MNETCQKFNEMIIPYLNLQLEPRDKLTFLEHLKDCRECRSDFVLMKQLQTTLIKEEKTVPKEIVLHAFDKVKEHQNELQSSDMTKDITNLLVKKIYHPMISLEVVSYVMNTIKNSVKLSIENI